MPSHSLSDARLQEYWDWVAVALFMLIPVDMLTSIYAAHLYGTHVEVNPVMRWALEQGIVALIGINLAATVLVTVLFYGLFRMIEQTKEPFQRVFILFFEVWMGLVLSVGFGVFANNLSLIILGQSLL